MKTFNLTLTIELISNGWNRTFEVSTEHIVPSAVQKGEGGGRWRSEKSMANAVEKCQMEAGMLSICFQYVSDRYRYPLWSLVEFLEYCYVVLTYTSWRRWVL